MGASDLEIFWKFRFPHGLPEIFGGLKVAISIAVVGAVVGDYVAGIRGLGYLQIFMAANVNTPMVFAVLAALSLIGIILFYAVSFIESLVVHWDPGRQAERVQQR
jgi:NitT/TauT family transport system permease protein